MVENIHSEKKITHPDILWWLRRSHNIKPLWLLQVGILVRVHKGYSANTALCSIAPVGVIATYLHSYSNDSFVEHSCGFFTIATKKDFYSFIFISQYMRCIFRGDAHVVLGLQPLIVWFNLVVIQRQGGKCQDRCNPGCNPYQPKKEENKTYTKENII